MKAAARTLAALGLLFALGCGDTTGTDGGAGADLSVPSARDLATEMPCGGRSGKTCPMGSFCELPVGQCNGAGLGTCRVIPASCGSEMSPVCGCDDMTYRNDCERRRAGLSAGQAGACP